MGTPQGRIVACRQAKKRFALITGCRGGRATSGADAATNGMRRGSRNTGDPAYVGVSDERSIRER
jgi:hypothetical protein